MLLTRCIGSPVGELQSPEENFLPAQRKALSGTATIRHVGRRVVMYSRRSCHLCDEARAAIEAERARLPFAFREVFIDGDDSLETAYGVRVPVVEIDGEEAFEFFIEPFRLRELLRRPAG